jgi:parallel beta-helix repeat protein
MRKENPASTAMTNSSRRMKTNRLTTTISPALSALRLRRLGAKQGRIMPGRIILLRMILPSHGAVGAWLLCGLLSGMAASAATLHVWQGSPSPGPPYTNWATAAHNIQNAVDAAQPGDTVLVTNGVYATRGRAVSGSLTNRVAIDKAITVQSVMGPQVTLIVGAPAPGGTNGDGAIRCVWLESGAVLSGFTLTNGHTRARWEDDYGQESQQNGGGCMGVGTLINCILINNSASRDGGGADGGTLHDCVLTGNSAVAGGGASGGTLYGCTLIGNSATYFGGGADGGTLLDCVLTGNSAIAGGGARNAALYHCTLSTNSAERGGGAKNATLHHCTLMGNRASNNGGGTHESLLYNCVFNGNSASDGGGDFRSHLYNCTLVRNSAGDDGGGADQSTLLNCILLGNTPTAATASSLAACWTTGDPGFVDYAADNFHLRPDSPCIDAGADLSATVTDDFEGNPRPLDGNGDGVAAFDIGAYEYRPPMTLYVWQNSPSSAAPFTTWATAAHNIQKAVDTAQPGDTVLVTNGVYATRGRAVYGSLTNRVAIDRPITVQSVNGPSVTWIVGASAPGGTNGDGAIRCVYVGSNAVLSGFTLTNGHTRTSGDYDKETRGGGAWGEVSGLVTNCMLTANSAYQGGGASGGTLDHCTLTRNSAFYGGGAAWVTLNNCMLIGNSAQNDGGGVCVGTLNHCTLTGNWAQSGGGAAGGTLNHCTLTSNSASSGGGAAWGALNHCTLTGNSVQYEGGGAVSGTLNHCTLTGNSAQFRGGGAAYGTLNNCIVYYNTAHNGPNYDGSTLLDHCCTTPLPATGSGNISSDPLLASASHLASGSPCIGRGSAAYSQGTDIDGEPWGDPPCIGCDEYWPGAVTGPLSVSLQAAYTNVAAGFVVAFTGQIQGRTSASRWEFGDGTVVSNRPYAQHAWMSAGDYPVWLTAFNEEHPAGVSATVVVRVVAQPVHYVAAGSDAPAPPYTNWATASRTIQKAVNAANVPGALVLVSNGVYATGGRAVYGTMTNRSALTNPVVVQSVNGPSVTWIVGAAAPGGGNGDGAVRCVYVGASAVLSGFTLTNGHTRTSGDWNKELHGGGAWCEGSGIISNCTLTGNSASESGGGAAWSTLNNCTLTGNSAQWSGGGAAGSILNNCTLTGNSAYSRGGGAADATLNQCTLTGNSAIGSGGGASYGTLNNCIVYYNVAPKGSNHDNSTLNYCCTTPLPTSGDGNISDEPLQASASHLAASSPCIGRGSAAYSQGTDIDGEPWGDPPCIGVDQLTPGQATGPITVTIEVPYTDVTVGFAVPFSAQMAGRLTSSVWDFGDGTVISNRPCLSHAWASPGIYAVRLTGYNDSFPGGVSATVMVAVMSQPIYYVNASNSAPAYPGARQNSSATHRRPNNRCGRRER